MRERTCTITGCDRPLRARGWCATHYARWKRHGAVSPDVAVASPGADRRCSIEGCDNGHHANGYCNKHAKRANAHGDANHSPVRSVEERFWEKVDAEGPCWEWTARRFPTGYGEFFLSQGKIVYAHRLAWELLVGAIPVGLELDHLCYNPPCVNPDHLEPITPAENKRRSGKGRLR